MNYWGIDGAKQKETNTYMKDNDNNNKERNSKRNPSMNNDG